MTIAFACPTCGSRYKVADDYAGRKARCNKCGSQFIIPSAGPPPKPPPIQEQCVEAEVVWEVSSPRMGPARPAPTANVETELLIVEQTTKELDSLMDQLAEAPADAAQEIQKYMQQKLGVYWRQIDAFKRMFPNHDQGRRCEAAYYFYCAGLKCYSQGFWRQVVEMDDDDELCAMVAHGLLARRQEKAAAQEALAMLDRSTSIFDLSFVHLFKAGIHRALGNPRAALWEVDFVISSFPHQQDDYIAARQMKDEILASGGRG